MSKAFDTVDRKLLIEDLSNVIDTDELHMLNLMLNVQLAIRCGSEMSQFFATDVGVPQGDGYSANEFTFYFAESLRDTKYKCAITSEHAYAKPHHDQHIRINGEYADDMNKITTDPITVDHHKNNLPIKLQARNLFINETKKQKNMQSGEAGILLGKTVYFWEVNSIQIAI